MEKEYSVWRHENGEAQVISKNERKTEGEKSRLLAQFNSFEEAYTYSKNLDESGVFQGNIAYPQTGFKDNDGYYFLTRLHPDDVILAIKDYCGDVDEELIESYLVDEVMRKVAEDIVDSLLNDLYWTSIISTLEDELPEMMKKMRERQ
jgi:hypothetical protein